MKISEVMTRDVQTVRPDQTAQEAASFMLQRRCRLDPGDRRRPADRHDHRPRHRRARRRQGPWPRHAGARPDDRRYGLRARSTTISRTPRRKMSEAQVRRLPVIDERGTAVRDRQPRRPQPREPTTNAPQQALEGVSQPGGQHQQ